MDISKYKIGKVFQREVGMHCDCKKMDLNDACNQALYGTLV